MADKWDTLTGISGFLTDMNPMNLASRTARRTVENRQTDGGLSPLSSLRAAAGGSGPEGAADEVERSWEDTIFDGLRKQL